jgi:hypothetical protein
MQQLTELCQRQALRIDRQIEHSLTIPSQILMFSRNHFSLSPIPAATLAQHSQLSVCVSKDPEPSGQAPSGLSRSSTPQANASHETNEAEEKRATDKRLRTAFYSRPNEIVVVPPVNWYYDFLQAQAKEDLDHARCSTHYD